MKLEITELFTIPGPITQEKYIMVINDSWELEVSKDTYYKIAKIKAKEEV